MNEGQPWRPFRLSDSKAQKKLESLALKKKDMDVRRAFEHDASRVSSLSWEMEGLYVDASKQRWDSEVLECLVSLAEEADVAGAISDLFGGVKLNVTENRSVLHMALRGELEDGYKSEGKDVMREVLSVRQRMLAFVDRVHQMHSREEITDVINIGIGGSDLGPAMAVKALRRFACGPRCHFVSNVDGAHVASVLQNLNPQTTMIVVVSKTFTTQETMVNARVAKAWLEFGGGVVSKQLVAVSTNIEGTRDFGIPDGHTFGFENWVGGRYSMWGPVGLSVALAVGSSNFLQFLAGGRAVDLHVKDTPLNVNVPVLLALLGHWNQNALGFRSHAVLPYAEDLSRLPAYLQQADMESNGKSIGRDGVPVSWNTGALVWGQPGTNSQHAFFQLLHQGTEIHPVDFVAFKTPTSEHREMHRMLLANALAQAEALMQGRDVPEHERHRFFPGNRPSTFFLFDDLAPRSLGVLVALHEHRIFVQGVLWGIASFDQWGVELGKAMANALLPELQGRSDGHVDHDASTSALLKRMLS